MSGGFSCLEFEPTHLVSSLSRCPGLPRVLPAGPSSLAPGLPLAARLSGRGIRLGWGRWSEPHFRSTGRGHAEACQLWAVPEMGRLWGKTRVRGAGMVRWWAAA